MLARGPGTERIILPELDDQDIIFLEKGIDEMENDLPPLNSFILPGGHILVSYCHIARTVCRRAERNLLRVEAQVPGRDIIEKFLNRLSDYLFILSRKIARDLNAGQVKWDPRK
jgi:cob(I)alamin adenosyltransferase